MTIKIFKLQYMVRIAKANFGLSNNTTNIVHNTFSLLNLDEFLHKL